MVPSSPEYSSDFDDVFKNPIQAHGKLEASNTLSDYAADLDVEYSINGKRNLARFSDLKEAKVEFKN